MLQQADLRPQSRKNEEHRQKQDGTNGFNSKGKLFPEAAGPRHDDARQKCAEERMNSDELGAEGRGQDDGQNDCKGGLVWLRAIEFRRA